MAIERGQSLASVALEEPSVDVLQLDLIMDFCFAVQELMDAKGINRKELARMMHKSPSAITRILNDDANITLKTLAEFQKALGLQVKITSGLRSEPGERETLEVTKQNESSAWALLLENG